MTRRITPEVPQQNRDVFRWLGLHRRTDLVLVPTMMGDTPVTVIAHFPDPKGTDMIPVAILVDEQVQDLLTPPACLGCGGPTGDHTHD